MNDQPINPYNAGPAQIPSPFPPGSAVASPASVEFELTPNDLAAWAWNKAMASRGMVIQFRFLRGLLTFVALVGLGATLLSYDPIQDFIAFIPSVAVTGAALALSFWFHACFRLVLNHNVRSLYNAHSTTLAHWRRRVEISATGISQKNELFETNYRWTAVQRIASDETHVFFDAGPLGEIIVPKSAFLHEAIFHAFVDSAQRFHQQPAPPANLLPPQHA